MIAFSCGNCGQRVFFENDRCLRCGSPLGYLHSNHAVVALLPSDDDLLVDLTDPEKLWQRCAGSPINGCNWLVAAGEPAMCESCRLTRTRPPDSDAEGLLELQRAEMAKRRLVYQLDKLQLPIGPRDELSGKGVAFDLLSSSGRKIVTGHDDGIITIDLGEADDAHREHVRLLLNEPYRTVLGHFRHEIGHYLWPILVNESTVLDVCRVLFGDDRADYSQAVENHYESFTDSDRSWENTHISRYATMHPYEDWAETFAHYLHILDTLETARSFGLDGALEDSVTRTSSISRQELGHSDGNLPFGSIIEHWLELSYGLNQINRSMGRDDLYPFVIAPTVVRKLAFVDSLVRQRQS